MEITSEMKLYRKRILPDECIWLKDDKIVKQNQELIITSWITLNPKLDFHHGCSCYFLHQGIKVSKFYREDNTLLYWYCDIVEYSYEEKENALTVTDLLADVIIYPRGTVKVVDLDELGDALERGLLTPAQLAFALRRLNDLLTLIYKGKFDQLQAELNNLGL